MKPQSTFSMLVLSLIALLMSCTPKAYFYDETSQRIKAHNQPLNQVQFYTDQRMVLKREVASADIQIKSGKVKFENGVYQHHLVFKKHTPGIFIKEDSSAVYIRFDNEQNKLLRFERLQDGTFGIGGDSTGIKTAEYGGHIYQIKEAEVPTRLLIAKKVADQVDQDKQRVKGIRVKE
jgi:hypothetical protein